jgi:plasmid stabilization system protein ParE
MARCEHHYIFCLSRDDAPALVVAIFHERMDLMVRLTDRLK